MADGFREQLRVLNHENDPVELEVRIEAASDFADLFEVKDALKKKGQYGRGRPETASCSAVSARYVHQGDLDLRRGRCDGRRHRAHVQRRGCPADGEWATELEVVVSLGAPDGIAEAPVGIRRPAPGPPGHGARAAEVAAARAVARLRLGAARAHLSALHDRPGGAPLLDAHDARTRSARRRPALVHDDLRPRQHLHQPAGAAVHDRTRRDHAARPGGAPGDPHRRLPRRGPGPDPARDALRRDDGLRGAAALPVLRQRGRHDAVCRAAR